MFAPDEKARLGEAPPKPEGAEWAPPLELITDIVYRTDEGGYLKPGYTHIYVVSADGGAPRQLTFGAFNETRSDLVGAGRRVAARDRQSARELAARAGQQRGLSRGAR